MSLAQLGAAKLVMEKLMKVLSHPGHGNSKCCIVGNWIGFRFLLGYVKGNCVEATDDGSEWCS